MPRRTPTSDVGTALARFNAPRHGITAIAPVIPGVESPDEWEAHYNSIVDAAAPRSGIESMLAAASLPSPGSSGASPATSAPPSPSAASVSSLPFPRREGAGG